MRWRGGRIEDWTNWTNQTNWANKRDYEEKIDKLKKEITLKENKALEYKKKIEELKNIKKNYDNVVHEANVSKQVNKKLREKIDNLTKYHNMWQTVTSENNKLKKQLKQFYIYRSHFNDGIA